MIASPSPQMIPFFSARPAFGSIFDGPGFACYLSSTHKLRMMKNAVVLGASHADQAGPELTMQLGTTLNSSSQMPLSPKCWHLRYVASSPAKILQFSYLGAIPTSFLVWNSINRTDQYATHLASFQSVKHNCISTSHVQHFAPFQQQRAQDFTEDMQSLKIIFSSSKAKNSNTKESTTQHQYSLQVYMNRYE